MGSGHSVEGPDPERAPLPDGHVLNLGEKRAEAGDEWGSDESAFLEDHELFGRLPVHGPSKDGQTDARHDVRCQAGCHPHVWG